jgi:hypothetical protein
MICALKCCNPLHCSADMDKCHLTERQKEQVERVNGDILQFPRWRPPHNARGGKAKIVLILLTICNLLERIDHICTKS